MTQYENVRDDDATTSRYVFRGHSGVSLCTCKSHISFKLKEEMFSSGKIGIRNKCAMHMEKGINIIFYNVCVFSFD